MLSHQKSKASAGAHADYRKLQAIMADLRALKQELDPGQCNTRKVRQRQPRLHADPDCLLPCVALTASLDSQLASEQQLSSLDAFSRAKHALLLSLHSLRADLDRLAAMRARLGEGGRDVESIRLNREVHEKLSAAGAAFQTLRALHTSASTPALLADRRDMLRLIGLELVSLTQAASASSASHVPASQEDQAIVDRVAARRQAAQEARQVAREARRSARGRGDRNANTHVARGRPLGADEFVIDIAGLHEVDLGPPPSAHEAAFHEQVDANRQTQDRLLDELLRGLDDLEQLARHAQTKLNVQSVALDQVDGAMDKNIAGFKGANRQLKRILQSTGGLTRWVPLMVCTVVLLALLGFIFGILK